MTDKRIKYIQLVTEELHTSVDNVYEDLMDGEYSSAIATLEKIAELAHDVKNTFSDEA